MLIVIAIILGVVMVIVIAIVSSYNRFVRQGQYIDNSWSNVDTELRRRYDLIPNLVETVKGYASHEKATFESVTAARAKAVGDEGPPEHQARTENALVGSLRGLLAVSEAYPELRADTSFMDLAHQLTATEDRIQAARRFYNNNVRAYNERVQTVPSNVIASIFKFRSREYFEIDAVATPSPGVAFDPSASDAPEKPNSHRLADDESG